MTGAFVRKYTDDQREAMASARLDRGVKYRRVVELAAAGELTTPDGRRLDPFDVPLSTVASETRRLKKQRLGNDVTTLAQLEPRDAIEALRRRMVSLADRELRDLERKAPGTVDVERFRQIGRVMREVQAIPGPKDQARPAPGAKTNGQREGGETKGGMAGALIAAHRNGEQASTAPDVQTTHTHTENSDAAQRSAPDATSNETKTDDGPGSLPRSVAARSLSAA